uniref:GIY-YIG endonuclease n=1 Tax=Cordyceps cicadae TaxID=218633 RepID=A0A481S193_9HYPO|nr:GIY-YIG endonuclease [Cordyceps cicadae]
MCEYKINIMNSTLCISSHKLSFNKIPITMQKRFYSSAATARKYIIKPTAIFVLKNLDNINICKELLKKKGGIYSFINTINGKQYIGSAKDFYISASHKWTFK